MGVSSSVGAERPGAARHSIRASFALRVAVPAGCLALLWVLALAVALRMALAGRSVARSHAILISYGLLGLAGLVAIAVAVVLIGSFGRRLARDLSALAAAAEQLAGRPAATRSGDRAVFDQDGRADAAILAAEAAATEVAEAATAIASLRQRAAAATASESGLRDGLRQVFVSLAKRNQSLLQRQLRLIDTLEQKAADPGALADLFALDHLTTRMRRHAESLAILSGAAPGRSWREPVPVIDVIRAAIAEVEDYRRVSVLTAAEDAVVGPAVADMIHLLAELIENATLYSPSGTRVEIRAGRVANGFAIEVDDRGLGIEPDQLREINQQLATPPDFDLADADRLGLFVGAKLAAKHGVRVSLRPSPYGGTSAIALLPNGIVAPGAFSQAGLRPDGEPQARPAIARPSRMDLAGTAALALTGRRAAEPPQPAGRPAAAALPAAMDRPAGIPAQDRPGTIPAVDRPGGIPAVDRPAGIPALDRPGTIPAVDRPGTIPAVDRPGTIPAMDRPGTIPAMDRPGTIPAMDRPGTAPGAMTAPGSAAGALPEGLPQDTAPGTHAGLPRRTRQASLSPHLRDPAPGAGGPPGAAPAAPAPERARDLAASVQSAWQRSRETGPDDPASIRPADASPADASASDPGAGGPGATAEPLAGEPPTGEPPAGELPVRKPAATRDQSQTPNSEESR
jgi:signal transduction histidine kinase